jgi:hypothetical protein
MALPQQTLTYLSTPGNSSNFLFPRRKALILQRMRQW